MATPEFHLFLSPHFDDAALSCGGQIHQRQARGQSVLVVTVFSGRPELPLSPFAEALHRHWGNPADVIVTRRAEDRAAMQILGARFTYLDYPDCIYRGESAGSTRFYASRAALFGPVHPAEQHFPDVLAARLGPLLPRSRQALIYAPLTAGNHVDHQLVHTAALRLVRPYWSVVFYEDYPYADRPQAVSEARAARGGLAWRAQLIALSAADLAARIEAVRAYQSQLNMLFGGAGAMTEAVSAYAGRIGAGPPAERLWWP